MIRLKKEMDEQKEQSVTDFFKVLELGHTLAHYSVYATKEISIKGETVVYKILLAVENGKIN